MDRLLDKDIEEILKKWYGNSLAYYYHKADGNDIERLEVQLKTEQNTIKQALIDSKKKIEMWKHNTYQMSANYNKFVEEKYMPLQSKLDKIAEVYKEMIKSVDSESDIRYSEVLILGKILRSDNND